MQDRSPPTHRIFLLRTAGPYIRVTCGRRLGKNFLMIRRREPRWRRGWDSNPRYGFPYTRFPSVRLKPLGHLSTCSPYGKIGRQYSGKASGYNPPVARCQNARYDEPRDMTGHSRSRPWQRPCSNRVASDPFSQDARRAAARGTIPEAFSLFCQTKKEVKQEDTRVVGCCYGSSAFRS
jgi:hypothetical protein